MAYMNWSDDLSVQINEIDEQHKKLVSQINALHDGMRSGKGKDALEKTLKELAEYTQYHFGTEEKYMKKFGYPDYEKHKKEHDAFVAKVVDFQDSFSSGKLGLSIDVMKFLSGWITGHIKGTDKNYIDCFRENGVA
ncbi:hemerythrin [Methanomicrobium sp. W14]|uniref:bacteriohemerythrin n=1 Tax=Methanomicrobium sp. W14 TaxID=2817839 RepID=UPI001AE6A25E|nr:bacteriohemerythrin [Methanomicrobium sp. W14]MBP2134341.1 hemerythrin [Methanomicrobium sp. W14]